VRLVVGDADSIRLNAFPPLPGALPLDMEIGISTLTRDADVLKRVSELAETF
jgi:hypothetical protein